MVIKHKELELNPDNPFQACKLGRKKQGDILKSIVASYADGFVLAINNKWGTGKTTFLKMWQQSLKNDGYRACYFNAWENDFNKDPMVAIVAELHETIGVKKDKAYASLLKKTGIFANKLLPAVAKTLLTRYTGGELAAEIIEKSTAAASDILREELDDYANKKKGLNEFRSELEKYVQVTGDGKPLIFIIDELDRCRPDYAVEILEHIKHFFSVAGIVFVLAIDKSQLLHAIKGFYGSAEIDADEYLRRFIDLEYSLPDPSIKLYTEYLYGFFGFDDYFKANNRINHPQLVGERHSLLNFAIELFYKFQLTLRQQEKIFSHVRITIRCFPENNYLMPLPLLFLIYLKNFAREFYDRIERLDLNLQDFVNGIHNYIPKEMNDNLYGIVEKVEAFLLFLYFNQYRQIHPVVQLYERKENDPNDTLLVESGFNTKKANLELLRILKEYERVYAGVPIKNLLDKIDLNLELVS